LLIPPIAIPSVFVACAVYPNAILLCPLDIVTAPIAIAPSCELLADLPKLIVSVCEANVVFPIAIASDPPELELLPNVTEFEPDADDGDPIDIDANPDAVADLPMAIVSLFVELESPIDIESVPVEFELLPSAIVFVLFALELVPIAILDELNVLAFKPNVKLLSLFIFKILLTLNVIILLKLNN